MKNIKNKILFIFLLSSLFACQDVINIDVQEGVNQLSVDALINDKPEIQIIKLTLSQNYFDNTEPKPILGASVVVIDENKTIYSFIDKKNNGNYVYDASKTPLNRIGKSYTLFIKYEDEEYYAISKLNRVPKIDSVNYEVDKLPIKPEEGLQEGFRPQFYATDLIGEGDCYWIKSARNSKYYNKASQISIAYDAGFSPGSKTDGLLFIRPIRSIGNELFADKDTLRVDLYSITQEQFYYLQSVQQVSQDGGLFSTPLANIPSNIVNKNTSSTKKAVGFFGISAVSSIQTIIDKAKAKPKQN